MPCSTRDVAQHSELVLLMNTDLLRGISESESKMSSPR